MPSSSLVEVEVEVKVGVKVEVEAGVEVEVGVEIGVEVEVRLIKFMLTKAAENIFSVRWLARLVGL